MALLISDIVVPVEGQSPDDQVLQALARKLAIDPASITSMEIDRKSLDARKKSKIVYRYRVIAEFTDEYAIIRLNNTHVSQQLPKPPQDPLADLKTFTKPDQTPVIIGSGPAGTFAALVLAEAGIKSLVLERGEPVESRMRTVHRLARSGEFSEQSNYCFGEGGAGTFSDGKLTCGRNHPLIRYLFQQWVRFGAPKDILYDAHPHIGTDFLMRIAKNMREYLVSLGVEYRFNTCVTDISKTKNGWQISDDSGPIADTKHIVLAIGHSARDTYEMLLEKGLNMSQKPFAVGARFEHPQEEIDKIQFGSCEVLPAAEYKLAAQVGDRGIWTFCMCPGGHLLPTTAHTGHLAINGMSYHARNSGFTNAAVVVNVRREDFDRGHPLDGMRFQQQIEQSAFAAGGSSYFSPAQRMVDFIAGQPSRGTLQSSYKPGIVNSRLDKVLPPFVVESLQSALTSYNKRMRGYISDNAIVAGVESKTSAPVIMPRDKSCQSLSHPGIFPTGEGAGFAGGIVSAALDGVQVARGILTSLTPS